MADTIRVDNKTARPLVITGKQGKRFLLSPGIGEVPSEIFREALSTRTRGTEGDFNILEKKRELGELEWDGDEKDSPEESKPLNELSERQALKVVKETFAPDLLATYREQDSRPKVRKAIDEKIAETDAAVAKGKSDGHTMGDIDEKQG
jgi:hypothetical protein